MAPQRSIVLTRLLVPKSRKVDFEVNVFIHDITNVPLVSGVYYVKWKLKYSSSERGFTQKAPIRDHTVQWSFLFQSIAELVVGKDGVLLPFELRLDVIQELHGGRDTHIIGNLVLNLSEYVGNDAKSRRYLLQDSKVNSMLKLSIVLKQRNMDVEFTVPPMKKQLIMADVSTMIVERDNIAARLQLPLGSSSSINVGSASSETNHQRSQGLQRSPSSTSLVSLNAASGLNDSTLATLAQPAVIQTSGPGKFGVKASDFLRESGEISPSIVVEQIFLGHRMDEIESMSRSAKA